MKATLYTFLVWVTLGTLAAAAHGQTDQSPGAPSEPAITADAIRDRMAGLAETDTAARELYEAAVAELVLQDAANKRREEAAAQAAEAPGLLESIRTELSQPRTESLPDTASTESLESLEQGQTNAEAQLVAARSQADELQAEATRRQARRVQIAETLAQSRRRQSELTEAARTLAITGELTAEADARRALVLAQKQAVTAEIGALVAELANYDARRDLLPARQDRAARRVAEAENLVAQWQKLVSAQRRSEANQAARDAELLRRQAAQQHPVLQAYAAESQRLAEQRTEQNGIPQRITRTSRLVSESYAQLNALRQQHEAVRRRINASGLNRATGLLLRRQHDELPDVSTLRQRVKATQRELDDAEYSLIELQEERLKAGDTDRAAQELLDAIGEDANGHSEELTESSHRLAAARRDLLDQAVGDSAKYFESLLEVDEVSRDLLAATEAHASFIRERILWVRSIAGNRMPSLEEFGDGIGWFVDPTAWSSAYRATRTEIALRPLPIATSMLAMALLVVASVWCRRRIAGYSELVNRYRTDSLSHTLITIGLTVMASLPVPAVLWWVGWVLRQPSDQADVAASVGMGLQSSAQFLLPMLFLGQLLRDRGVAEAHFRWPAPALRSTRRYLRWFLPIATPSILLVVAVERHGDEAMTGSVGRAAFTIGMLALSVFLYRILRPNGSVISEFLRRNKGGWIDRLRYIWYPALVAIPLVLIVLTWIGFFYTAQQLETRLENTITLLLILILINGVLLRWLFVARRRVAIEDARRRRDQAIAEAESKAAVEEGMTEDSIPPIEEDKLDLPAISLQTRQLFRTAMLVSTIVGLYMTWADVLPALRMLDRVEVYPNQQIVELHDDTDIAILSPSSTHLNQQAPAGNKQPASSNSDGSVPGLLGGLPSHAEPASQDDSEEQAVEVITLADVGFAVLVLIATLVTFRNLPGLVEIAVLQKLPLDAGSRYAMSTVLKYSIAIVGLAVAFGTLGLSWHRVQWLAAALTFGLAFGVQEIFANFVSGLIILAERPIRIGDTVTVGNVSGTVTRIRMRATTVTDWDRKELVIPNKTFITGEVINWSLSDPILRIILTVGVSYDADVRKAESLLLKIAKKHPVVLSDPKPFVVFNRFGDSTLDFELRTFIPSIEHLHRVRHDLHMRIIEEFRKAGIEIAFPQRDLHIRSIDSDITKLVARQDKPQAE